MLTSESTVLKEVHICPHCEQKMSCVEAPQIHVGDGLGWGSDVLFICLNDACQLFLDGWQSIEERYGHHASYRYMELPGSKESNIMMVGNKDAFKASVIDPATIERQNKRYQKEKTCLEALDTCLEKKDTEPVLTLILDEAAHIDGRKKAIELIVPLNDLGIIDPIRNHKFKDKALEHAVNLMIAALLKNNFKKECRACGEIVKQQAKICMYCKESFE
ncbi:MAG: zinc ribbon domain-containing protein [Deltaproteobacteria bacterium]|nr:MAG: zinc ribbon domain-containing protein [Deltaproteobacteria bacterium]